MWFQPLSHSFHPKLHPYNIFQHRGGVQIPTNNRFSRIHLVFKEIFQWFHLVFFSPKIPLKKWNKEGQNPLKFSKNHPKIPSGFQPLSPEKVPPSNGVVTLLDGQEFATLPHQALRTFGGRRPGGQSGRKGLWFKERSGKSPAQEDCVRRIWCVSFGKWHVVRIQGCFCSCDTVPSTTVNNINRKINCCQFGASLCRLFPDLGDWLSRAMYIKNGINI